MMVLTDLMILLILELVLLMKLEMLSGFQMKSSVLFCYFDRNFTRNFLLASCLFSFLSSTLESSPFAICCVDGKLFFGVSD